MTRESNVYARLKDRVARPTDRFDRIENGIGVGMPDVNYCILGCEGWIEIKAPHEPARPSTALLKSNHPLGVDQVTWFRRQHMARGLAWLFVASGQRLLLIKGSSVSALGARINSLSATELEGHAVWKTPVPVKHPEFWADLREMLATPP